MRRLPFAPRRARRAHQKQHDDRTMDPSTDNIIRRIYFVRNHHQIDRQFSPSLSVLLSLSRREIPLNEMSFSLFPTSSSLGFTDVVIKVGAFSSTAYSSSDLLTCVRDQSPLYVDHGAYRRQIPVHNVREHKRVSQGHRQVRVLGHLEVYTDRGGPGERRSDYGHHRQSGKECHQHL